MNKTVRRAAGIVAINAQLTAIVGKPASLKQLMACFKTSSALRRAWKHAHAAAVAASAAEAIAAQPPQRTEPAPEPAAKSPESAPAPIAPAQPAQTEQPAAPQWSATGGKFGAGKWG